MSRDASPPRRRCRWPFVLIGIALLVGIAAAAVLSLPTFGGKAPGERLARMQADPHYRDGAFVNDVEGRASIGGRALSARGSPRLALPRSI